MRWGHGLSGRKPGRIGGVSVQLNYTIVSCRDQQSSAAFLADCSRPAASGFSLVVQADNGISLDFSETSPDIASQHYVCSGRGRARRRAQPHP
jgi:hypothetical protein